MLNLETRLLGDVLLQLPLLLIYTIWMAAYAHAAMWRVPWPFPIPVLEIWGADVDLCVETPGLTLVKWNTVPPSPLLSACVSGSVFSLCLPPFAIAKIAEDSNSFNTSCPLTLNSCMFSFTPELFQKHFFFSLFPLCHRCVWQLFPFTEWEGLVGRHPHSGTGRHQRRPVLLHTPHRQGCKIHHSV